MSEDASAPLLHQVAEILGQEPDLHVVIAFGSAAGGDFRPDSDLDVAVCSCEGPLSAARRQELIVRDDAALVGLITRMLFDSADFLPLRERVLRERREAWIGR